MAKLGQVNGNGQVGNGASDLVTLDQMRNRHRSPAGNNQKLETIATQSKINNLNNSRYNANNQKLVTKPNQQFDNREGALSAHSITFSDLESTRIDFDCLLYTSDAADE